ncbi:MAG: hypothetical protein ACYSTL_06970, partial [Planctomycetota bacterium]
MQKRRWFFIAAATIGFVLAGHLSATWASERSIPGAYGRMDAMKLSEQLAAMGMFELLEAFAAELEEPRTAKYLLARSRIARSRTPHLPADERKRLIDGAVAVLEELTRTAEPPDDPEQLIAHFRMNRDFIEAAGLMRCEPFALRVMYLQPHVADKRKLIELTDSVIPRVRALNRDIADTLQDWRLEATKLVTVVPELEALRDVVRYESGWIRFYRASALPGGAEKTQLLSEALGDAEKFALGDAGSGVLY